MIIFKQWQLSLKRMGNGRRLEKYLKRQFCILNIIFEFHVIFHPIQDKFNFMYLVWLPPLPKSNFMQNSSVYVQHCTCSKYINTSHGTAGADGQVTSRRKNEIGARSPGRGSRALQPPGDSPEYFRYATEPISILCDNWAVYLRANG